MKATVVTILAGLLALLYLNTAVVIPKGGGNSILVFRPFHGVTPFYGGGEEGSWRREHPNQPDPWWHAGPFTRLAVFHDEASDSPGLTAYAYGYYATLLGIIGLIIYYSVRYVFPKSRNA